MDSVIKGNFKTIKEVVVKNEEGETLEDRFEKEALAKLGGSIAFVSRKKVLWPNEESDDKSK